MTTLATLSYDAHVPPLTLLSILSFYSSITSLSSLIKVEPSTSQTEIAEPLLTFTNSKEQIRSSALIARYLARLYDETISVSNPVHLLYGKGPLQTTQIDYFLLLAPALSNKDELTTYAVLLNEHLSFRTTLVSDHLTLADLVVYESLQSNTRWNNLIKTQSNVLPHLVRWSQFITSHHSLAHANALKQQLLNQLLQQKLDRSKGGSYEIDMGPGAEKGKVVTRFPPEPSGYMHIGHAKAALLNDYIAKSYDGKLILRFDDTNPKKEKEEYVDNILDDLKTLEVKYDKITHTSDYFDLIIEKAKQMLKTNKAYIDNTPVEEMRKMRMDGIESACRNQPVEENLRLFDEMLKGSEEGLKCCMRARISMQSKNKALRDPTLFRCNLIPHHRTGSKYKAYPTYDFACPIVDSHEGVTHALRTNEYRDRNEQYYWVCDALDIRKPIIRDYSRLNFVYTTLSKRKLTWFVDTNRVSGWNDPRMPTIQGILRRGMSVEALRKFIHAQGFSQAVNMMEYDKLWTINKQVIDPIAHRFTAIGNDLEAPAVVLTLKGAETQVGAVSVDVHPKHPEYGKKVITRSGSILVEYEDALTFGVNEEITLLNWGNAIITDININPQTKRVESLRGIWKGDGDVKKTKKITWIDAALPQDIVPVTLVELDSLISVPKVEEDMDFEKIVRPQSWFETPALGEVALSHLQKGEIIQLNRRGYCIVEEVYKGKQISSGNEKGLVLIMIPDGRTKNASILGSKVDKAKLVKAAPSTLKMLQQQ